MKQEHIDAARHALGLGRSRIAYRNYYCCTAEEENNDYKLLQEMSKEGTAKFSHLINEDRDAIFNITEAGAMKCLLPGESTGDVFRVVIKKPKGPKP